MQFIVKYPKQCTWKELAMIYTIMGNLSLLPSPYLKKIARCSYLGLCIKDNNIIGLSAIKKPIHTWIKKIEKKIGIVLPKKLHEYGYIYVLPKYRGLGITKKLHNLLFKNISTPIYAITRTDNIAMKKLLKEFGFSKKGIFNSYINNKNMYLYLKLLDSPHKIT